MARAEDDLGLPTSYLAQHEDCVTESRLTREERMIVLGHVTQLIETRPRDWSFVADGCASIDGLSMIVSVGRLVIFRPHNLGWWSVNEPAVRRVMVGLHRLRHQNGNHVTRALEVCGIDFRTAHAVPLSSEPRAGSGYDFVVWDEVPAVVDSAVPPAEQMQPEEIEVERVQAQIDRTAGPSKAVRVNQALQGAGLVALFAGIAFGVFHS